MTPGRALAGVAIVLAAALAGGCRACSAPAAQIPPPDPESAALSLFEAARPGGLPEDRIPLLFAGPALDQDSAPLLDKLAPLARARSARIVHVETLDLVGRTVVDLEADLEGGGTARFTVQAARQDDGTWRVVWFGGPDGSWPVRKPPRPAATMPLPDR